MRGVCKVFSCLVVAMLVSTSAATPMTLTVEEERENDAMVMAMHGAEFDSVHQLAPMESETPLPTADDFVEPSPSEETP